LTQGLTIGGHTRLLAVIGHPVRHTLSPAMHNASFAAEGLDFVYVALEVAPEDLPAATRGAAALGFRGFNATIPHKRALVPLMDDLDEAARVSGAVNTVVIDGEKLTGYNTDGSGLLEACGEGGVTVKGKSVLLLGAGGAAASAAFAFGQEGAADLRIVNRTPERALRLSEELRAVGTENVEVYPPDAIGEAAGGAEIVVNATSLGMKDEDRLPIPASYLDEGKTVCDAVYRAGQETALIREARLRGARVVTGKRMLLYQGVLAQKLWTGHEPNVQAMEAAL
jgi:shikimate dehydrogenase